MPRPDRRPPTTLSKPAPGDDFGGEETFRWLGERLRRLALGLTALLFVVRAFYPSEDAESGSGLIWVFGLLAASAIGIAWMLFSGVTRIRWSWADAAVLVLIVLVGLSASGAAERRPAITMAWEWGGLGLLYFLVRNLPRTRNESAAIAGAVAATAVAVALYGLYQIPVEFSALRRMYTANPDFVVQRMGFTPGSPTAEALKQRIFSNEPFSTFALANSLAGFLVGPMALTFGIALENLKREGRSSRVVALAMAAVPGLVVLVCLILTKSRSAYVGLFVAILVLAWRARGAIAPRTLIVSALGLIVLVGGLTAAGVATKQLDVQVVTEASKSFRYRWEYWVGTWGVITDAPSPFVSTGLASIPGSPEVATARRTRQTFWWGLGPANFGGPYLGHKLPQASEEILDPHNMILEVWETAGLFAALAFLAALGIGLREILGPARFTVEETSFGDTSSKDPGAPPARAGWLVAWAAMGWIGVWVMGKLNPINQADLLLRWLVLGVGWILALGMGSALWRRRPIPASSLGVGVLALAISLLAAGGIGIPSVAMSLWVLLALGLNLREDRRCGVLRPVGGLGASVLLACVWAALAGTFFGAVVPAWKSDAAFDRGNALMASKTPAFEPGREAYAEAIQADPYSVKPWVAMAELEYRYWRSPEGLHKKEPIWTKVLILMDDALDPRRRNPDNLALRRRQAEFARMILNDLPNDAKPIELLDLKATIAKAWRRAARIYPTSAIIRFELAQASAGIGMNSDAVREAEQALLLDEKTPHLDKKLPANLREYLKVQLPRWKEAAAAPPPPPPSPSK